MKVLVVDDERKIANLVRKALEAAGFVVDTAGDGIEAGLLIETHPYDAVILDIMIPGRDGLSLLRQVRRAGNPVPILLLTARSSPDERVEGLNLGADDYLPKPFHLDELLARLHAILRRGAGTGTSILRIRDLKVNLITREARRGAEPLELTGREHALLTCLMREPGRVFTRGQICERVWNYHHDPGTNLVDVYIQRLRRKIGDDAGNPLLQTVRGIGYRMAST